MEIFKTLKSDFKWLGLFEWHLSTPYFKIRITPILKVGILSSMSLSAVTSFCYFLFEANCIRDQSESFLYSIGSLVLVIWYIISLKNLKMIEYFFNAVQKKIGKRIQTTKINTVKWEYMRINEWVEKRMRWLRFFYFKIYVPLFVFPLPCFILYEYISTNYVSQSLQLMILASFPYNWHSLHGYLLTWIVQVLEFVSMVAFGYGFLCFYAGFCTFLSSFVGDITKNLIELNDDIKWQQKIFNIYTHFRFRKRFCEIIQFHAEAIQLTEEFSQFCSKFTSIFFIVDGFAIAIALLQLTTAIDIGSPTEIIRSLIVLSSALIWIFIFCYFGNKVTSAYEELGKSIYLCEWDLFPMELQKYLPMMMTMAQKPLYVRAFGRLNCTLATFKEIINNAYKLFAVLKELI